MHELRKITWAVDVLGESEPSIQVLAFLRVLAASTQASVDPVFLLSPAQAPVLPSLVRQWDEALLALAEKKLALLTRSSSLPTIQKGTILLESDDSTHQAASRIVAHAKDGQSDAIVVSTHARKGLARFFLGSFAETLLLQSSLPMITVNPTTEPLGRIAHILFPTDFGQPSRRGFEAMVEFSKTMDARLTLFFKEPPVITPSNPGAPLLVYNYSEGELNNRKKLAKSWMNWAKSRGVRVSLEMDETPGNIPIAITECATASKVDLISMISQSGPVSTLLLGSVTRQVLRNSHCPVWIRHS